MAYRFFFVEKHQSIWKSWLKDLEPNKGQPNFQARQNASKMAHPERLTPFEKLSYIGDYAERFGLDPDEVYWKTSAATVMEFAIERKERSEFRERFDYIYSEILKAEHGNNNPPSARTSKQ